MEMGYGLRKTLQQLLRWRVNSSPMLLLKSAVCWHTGPPVHSL